MSRRTFFALTLLVALLVAGVASYYASSHPDGLEFVAEKTGFSDSAKDSPAADSPFADYSTSGVEDPRISGGLAGVVGCVAVLALMSGVAFVVRRRGGAAREASSSSSEHSSDQVSGGA